MTSTKEALSVNLSDCNSNCDACGAAFYPNARFCAQCGEPAPVAPAKPGSAKRKRADQDERIVKKLKVDVEKAMTPRKRPSSSRKAPSKSPSRRQIMQMRQKEKDDEPKWPARARFFKCWKRDFVFDLVREVLEKRGWTDLGDLCDPEDVDELVIIAKCRQGNKLPRRCLWWVHEEDGRRLRNLPKEDMATARHCIGTFLGTDAAVTKVAITECNNDEPWYPTSFVLPSQMKLLQKAMKSTKNNYWIAKPRDDYGGKNMTVYNGKMKEFKDLINHKDSKCFVVQSYIPDPLLISGYKFHFRMYTILAGVLDKFECYLSKIGTALFSTEVFSMEDKTLGNDFDPYVHLTNWSINFTKKNLERLVKKKPFIGRGCETTLAEALRAIKKENPKFDVKDFWKQMAEICGRCMYRIAQWKNVKKYKGENNERPRFENFGIDLMMDTSFKVWLLEANTQVGLNPGFEPFPDPNCKDPLCIVNGCMKCNGVKNVRYDKNNDVMRSVISATLDLMQLDVPKSKRKEIIPKVIIPLHPLIEGTELEAQYQPKKAAKVKAMKTVTPKVSSGPKAGTPKSAKKGMKTDASTKKGSNGPKAGTPKSAKKGMKTDASTKKMSSPQQSG